MFVGMDNKNNLCTVVAGIKSNCFKWSTVTKHDFPNIIYMKVRVRSEITSWYQAASWPKQ